MAITLLHWLNTVRFTSAGRWLITTKPTPYLQALVCTENLIRVDDVMESPKLGGMIGLFYFALAALASPFKSKLRLQAENAVLRHQLIVLRRRRPGRVRLANNDRWFLIQLYRWFPSILQVLTIIRPETLLRWHRAGFRGYWRWKSRPLGGRPQIDTELRALIRRMSMENPLWVRHATHKGSRLWTMQQRFSLLC
jgi:hypothetical protein